jgi:hypothetical protein
MLKCEDCNHIFDEAVERRHFDGPFGEEMDPPTYHCPNCNSEFIVTAKKCCYCGEVKESIDFTDDFCDECLNKIGIKAKEAIAAKLTEVELEALKVIDLFEGGLL